MKARISGFFQILPLIALAVMVLGGIAIAKLAVHPSVESTSAAPTENTFTLVPNEDSYVSSATPNKNHGKTQNLLSGDKSKFTTYLKFDLSTLKGKNITSAKLKLHATDTSSAPQEIKVVSGSWNESTVTYRNRPRLGATVMTFQAQAADWVTIDFGQFVSTIKAQNLGVVSFAITSTQADSVEFHSRESTLKPYLEFVETVFSTPQPSTSPVPTVSGMPSMTPMPSGTPAPNGSAPGGGFGVGSGDGMEIGIKLATFNQAKADAAKGVYDRPCTDAEHDKTKWHSLVNPVAKCHYDHEHGDDPNYTNDVFGEPGAWFANAGQSISYPWQTFSLPATTTAIQALAMFGTDGQKENDLKHPGYYWVVRRGQTCDGAAYCITDSRLQFHFMSSHHNEVGVRFHSFSFEGRLCKDPNDASTCGIYRTGGWTDHGQLIVTNIGQECWIAINGLREGRTDVSGTVVSLPTDSQFFPLNAQGLIDELRCHKNVSDSIVKSFPNGYMSDPTAEWWTHGASDFRYKIRVYDPISNVDTALPTGISAVNQPFCKQGDPTCRWNNSIMTAGQGYTTQIYKDYGGVDADSNGDNKTDMTYGKVYMNRFGDQNYKCTAAGLDCIPLMITNVLLGENPKGDNQRYSNKQCETCTKLDHDLTPAGVPSWIQWFYKM
jgi:LysM repeat protein